MPSLPELRDIFRYVRKIEVVHEVVAESFCSTYCHIGISRKVAINLYGISDYCEDKSQGVIALGVFKHSVNADRQIIGNNDFFEKAECETPDTLFEVSKAYVSILVKLMNKVLCFYDRTCNELREKGYIKSELYKALFCIYRTSYDVNGITKRLEGIEGNSYRKNYIKHTCVFYAEKRSERADKEIEVLKEAERYEGCDDRNVNVDFFAGLFVFERA